MVFKSLNEKYIFIATSLKYIFRNLANKIINNYINCIRLCGDIRISPPSLNRLKKGAFANLTCHSTNGWSLEITIKFSVAVN